MKQFPLTILAEAVTDMFPADELPSFRLAKVFHWDVDFTQVWYQDGESGEYHLFDILKSINGKRVFIDYVNEPGTRTVKGATPRTEKDALKIARRFFEGCLPNIRKWKKAAA
jgi:hypothetical protein